MTTVESWGYGLGSLARPPLLETRRNVTAHGTRSQRTANVVESLLRETPSRAMNSIDKGRFERRTCPPCADRFTSTVKSGKLWCKKVSLMSFRVIVTGTFASAGLRGGLR